MVVSRRLCDAVGLSPDPDGSLLLHEDYGEPPVAEPSADFAHSPRQPRRGRFCSVARPRCDFGDPHPDHCALSHRTGRLNAFRLLGNHFAERRRSYSTAVSPPRAGSGLGGSRAEPLLRGRLLGKGRLLEPKPPYRQNARVRTGIGKKPKTCRWCLRATAAGNSHCAPTTVSPNSRLW